MMDERHYGILTSMRCHQKRCSVTEIAKPSPPIHSQGISAVQVNVVPTIKSSCCQCYVHYLTNQCTIKAGYLN